MFVPFIFELAVLAPDVATSRTTATIQMMAYLDG